MDHDEARAILENTVFFRQLRDKGRDLPFDVQTQAARDAFLIFAGEFVRTNDAIRAYVALGMPVDVRGREEWALHRTAREEYRPERLELFIELGADLEVRNNRGETPLFEAVRTCELGNPRLLLEAGASADVVDARGRTLVHVAVRCNAQEALALLLERGLDPQARDNSGNAPIHEIVMAHRWKLDLLLRHGADIDCAAADGSTLAHMAAGRGKLHSLREVLARGADRTREDAQGRRPIDRVRAGDAQAEAKRALLDPGPP